MDIEVRQAQRTLQRAGIQTLTEAATLEEFPLQYGNLLLAWFKRHELPCHVLRVPDRRSLRVNDMASRFLKDELQSEVRHRNSFSFRKGSAVSQMVPTLDDDQIMATYLAFMAPTDITRMYQVIAQSHAGYGLSLKSSLFFFVESAHRAGYPEQDQVVNVTGYIYMYTIPTQEDIAKEAASLVKQAQKKAATAEKRRKTMEAKEKALLKKLQDKYADSDAS